MRILIVEDNPKLAAALGKGLEEQGWAVLTAANAEQGQKLAGETLDLIILDVMLPDRDGVELCRSLRNQGVTTPILMLTALGETRDKVVGLDAGADDYVTKPFEFEELLARVRALLRRPAGAGESAILRYDDLEMDLVKREVKRAGQPIALKHKEFALLEYFLRNPDRVLTRTNIGEHVWDINFNPFSNVIDVHVSMLRRKIDKPFGRPLIHTVVGSGYRFGAAQQQQQQAP